MCNKPVYLLILIACIFATSRLFTNRNAMADQTPVWSIEQKRYYKTLDDLRKDWFAHHTSITTSEGTLKNLTYYVIADSPYSGTNGIDVYVYLHAGFGAGWRLYTVTFLPGANKTTVKSFTVETKVRNASVELWHNEALFMTLDFADGIGPYRQNATTTK